MKARRQIVDPLTGANVRPDSPNAVDTGQRVVGRGTVVDDEELDPRGDRFGIASDAVADVRAREREERRRAKELAPKGRSPAFPTTMSTPAAGVREFFALNPELEEAVAHGDIRDETREFMDSIEVRVGKGKEKKLAKTPTGEKILGTGQGWDGRRIASSMLQFLFGQSRSRRWRDVPWQAVKNYAEAVAPHAPVMLPVASGTEPPAAVLARVQEEYGPRAAAKLKRQMAADELGSLADRMERALDDKGEECLSGAAISAARERLAILRRWQRSPERVPEWSCGGTTSTAGACSFPAILEDVQRLEGSCDRDYDPRWPIKRARKACDEGDDAEPTGIVGEPCAIARQADRDATPEPKYAIRFGRLVRL